MNNNCCKEFGYNLSKSLLESNGNEYNIMLLKQFKMCIELKKFGNKCVQYEKVLSKNG